MNQVSTMERPRRPEYSAEFKASVLDQCRQPGASVAGIALGYRINPNMAAFRQQVATRIAVINGQLLFHEFFVILVNQDAISI